MLIILAYKDRMVHGGGGGCYWHGSSKKQQDSVLGKCRFIFYSM